MNKRAYNKDQSKSISTPLKRQKAILPNTAQETWKHYFHDGRQAFQATQYKEALEYFTHALKLEPNHLTLLDSRAATFEKLKDWEPAMKDAVAMVKLSPTCSKGYLRYGKLLSLQHRYTSAVKVYLRGCRTVDPQEARYSLLVSLKKEMEQQVKLAVERRQGQRDPIKILPYDVLDLVFSYIPFHRRIACTMVSTCWRKFLLNWSGMWRNMDLVTGALGYNSVSKKTLGQYLSYTPGRHLRRISLSVDKAKTDYALQLLIDKNCHYLEYLGLAHSSFTLSVFLRTLRLMGRHLTHLYLDNCDEGFGQIFDQLATTCPQLSHLYYGSDIRILHQLDDEPKHNYRNLKQLHLVIDIPQDALKRILHQCPNLTHLVLPQTSITPAWILRHVPPQLQVYYHAIPSGMALPTLWDSADTSVTKTGLWSFTVMGSTLDDESLTALIQTHHTTLEIINLNQTTGFRNSWCSLLMDSPLAEIQLERCTALDETDLEILINNCPLLRIVVMSYNQSVTNRTLQVMSTLERLERLDVSACLRVTGSGIRSLVVERHSSLKKLLVNECTAVQPDVIDYARSILGRKAVEYTFGKRR